MFVKEFVCLFLTVAVLGSCVIFSSVYAKENSLQSQILDHAGKSYTGAQDPSYLNYDLALREYMADRIGKRFGIALDPKAIQDLTSLKSKLFSNAKDRKNLSISS
jgi:hypothetical protein